MPSDFKILLSFFPWLYVVTILSGSAKGLAPFLEVVPRERGGNGFANGFYWRLLVFLQVRFLERVNSTPGA